MCSIAFIKNLKDGGRVNDLARVIYEGQKDRGNSAFGVVAFDSEMFYADKWTSEQDFLTSLDKLEYSEMMIHARFPTSTPNVLSSCHPFSITLGNKVYHIIHNGIIHNADEVQKKHFKSGIKYSSWIGKQKESRKNYFSFGNDPFNDSESLAWDFAMYLDSGREIEVTGSVAMMCLVQDKDSLRAEKLYFYRNSGNPMTMLQTDSVFILASQGLPDSVEMDKLFYFDYATGDVVNAGVLKINSGRKVNEIEWDNFGLVTDNDNDYDYGQSICDDIKTYDQALDVLEWLSEDYKGLILSGSEDDLTEAMEIEAEANEIMETYKIPKDFLISMGIAF